MAIQAVSVQPMPWAALLASLQLRSLHMCAPALLTGGGGGNAVVRMCCAWHGLLRAAAGITALGLAKDLLQLRRQLTHH
jgi:hypothetical protein